MIRLSSIDQIAQLYAARGGQNYGENVTQLEHALQCAALAQASGSAPSLIVAALLHDIGHLFEREEAVTGFTADDRHQATGARVLSDLFGPDVCQPVALHVAAKRYLCFTEPSYHDALSVASKKSLALQGGPFDGTQAEVFAREDFALDAVALRRFDDTGKSTGPCSMTFNGLLPLMHRVATQSPMRRGLSSKTCVHKTAVRCAQCTFGVMEIVI